MKNRIFFSIQRNRKLPIRRSLHYQRFDMIKRSTRKPSKDGFSFSFALVFRFSITFFLFWLVLFYFEFCEIQE